MILEGVALFGSAVLGGGLNSVAGGGSFLTFPALIVTGVPSVRANATSTVALWPGSLASVGAYRRELTSLRYVRLLSAVSLIGGLLGALLLLRTPASTFSQLIPYLLLGATVLFAFNGQIKQALRRFSTHNETPPGKLPVRLMGAQLVISTYGGYFGGGIGILMLAALGMFGMENIHEMNALKTLLASCINGIAVLAFVIAGAVAWPQALLMLCGAVIGGYAGAAMARKLNPVHVRRFVVVVGCVMTAYFFLRK